MLDLKKECPLEGNCKWDFLYNTTGAHRDLSIYVCGTCGLQSLNPRAPQKVLYNADYYTGKAEYSYKDERKTEKYHAYVWKARLENIKKFVSSGRLLDIGSSFGGFLLIAKKEGYEVQGVEISSYASDFANGKGINTFCGTLLQANFPSENFDVITLVEVIEHLENPHLIFPELRRILKPGGLLLLQTANFEGWQARRAMSSYHYYMPGHVFYYSDSNLKKILTRLNFNHFISYFGVDFSLLSKLKKSRGSFKGFLDYFGWIKISYYHFKSKFKKNGFPLTSSYVLYAFKSR